MGVPTGGGWDSSRPLPGGPLLARRCEWRAVGRAVARGCVTSFLSGPDSCWIPPPPSRGLGGGPGEQGKRTPKPHQQTSEALLGKSLVLVSLATSPTGTALGLAPCLAWGMRGRGGGCQRGDGPTGEAGSVQRWDSHVPGGAETGKYGGVRRKLDVRTDLRHLSTNTLRKEK